MLIIPLHIIDICVLSLKIYGLCVPKHIYISGVESSKPSVNWHQKNSFHCSIFSRIEANLNLPMAPARAAALGVCSFLTLHPENWLTTKCQWIDREQIFGYCGSHRHASCRNQSLKGKWFTSQPLSDVAFVSLFDCRRGRNRKMQSWLLRESGMSFGDLKRRPFANKLSMGTTQQSRSSLTSDRPCRDVLWLLLDDIEFRISRVIARVCCSCCLTVSAILRQALLWDIVLGRCG